MELEQRRQFELLGAQVRLKEIDEERADIIATYPELAQRTLREPGKRFSIQEITKDFLVEKAKQSLLSKSVRSRKVYDEAFKTHAVNRIANGEWIPDVARSEKVAESLLRTWCVKKDVVPKAMPSEERIRRMQSGRGTVSLPEKTSATTTSKFKTPKIPEVENSSQKLSIRIGLQVLATMPDDEPIAISEIAKKLDKNATNTSWLVRKRQEEGHITRVAKGMYQKTAKGRRFQAETLPP